MTERQKGFAAILLAGVLWSTGGVFIKLVELPPLSITAWRSGFAALVFAVFFGRSVLRTNPQMWLNSLFYACTLLAFVTATKLTTAANAIFLQFTAPVYVLLFEPFLFKIPLRRADIWMVAACLGGMALFFVGDLKTGDFWGNLLALGSGVGLAAFMLGQRMNRRETHFAAIFWGNIFVVAVSAVAFTTLGLQVWPGWSGFWMLAFLGIVQIGTAYALFTYGLQRTLAIEASLLAFVEPILNPIWVWLGYGEKPSGWALLGGAVVIGSLSVWTIFKRKTAASTRET